MHLENRWQCTQIIPSFPCYSRNPIIVNSVGIAKNLKGKTARLRIFAKSYRLCQGVEIYGRDAE